MSDDERTCGKCARFEPQRAGNPYYGSCRRYIGSLCQGTRAKDACEIGGRYEFVRKTNNNRADVGE